MKRALIPVLLACLCAGSALAQHGRRFDPSVLKGPPAGPPNRVMVLATPHLSGMATLTPDALAPLIDRLARWQPQEIAIEALSGEQCANLRRYPDRYRDTVDSYCWDPEPARAATGLDVPTATAAAAQLLADWPAAPQPAQRRHLAAVFLAGGEQMSALVQWLRLPVAERHVGDGLDAALVARLETLRAQHNETSWIAAPLAARLGLERVYAMDDHSADAPVADEAGFDAAIGKAWANPATARRKATGQALEARLGEPGGVVAMYRSYNAPTAPKLVFDSDFGAALADPSPQRFGRLYLGYWETRNLRMAANIREMLGFQPGTRALVIVGASHKGYLDAYLDQMHDVVIADTQEVLR